MWETAHERSDGLLLASTAEDPLILSFSPRGEGTPELASARIRASSLPLGRETE
jgi:hypothetical protein